MERSQGMASGNTGFQVEKSKYSGGASCPFLFGRAKEKHNASDQGPLIWSIDDVDSDDMILWMYGNGDESKSPGHIAIIYDMDEDNNIVSCAESSGEDDGQGHSGPRLKDHLWGGEKSSNGRRYIELDHGGRVIVVRPPDQFG
jgi:hypothetical protein